MTFEHKKLIRRMYFCILGFTVLAFGLGFYWLGMTGALVAAGSLLCLALGFWLTETLVGLITGVKKANTTAVGFLFLGKLGWWIGIFLAAKWIPEGNEKSLALGFGFFLLAIFVAGLSHFGLPKISDA